MMMYIKYFWYLIRHKWFVLVECFKHRLFWQGIIHDISKFRPSEFIPYAKYFYGKEEKKNCNNCIHLAGSQCDFNYSGIGNGDQAKECSDYTSEAERDFNEAWLLHIHRNPHHWQYWILIQDKDKNKILEMPKKYALEMFCDWNGAGKAQGFGNNTEAWYGKHKKKIQLHPKTRVLIEVSIAEME